MVRLAHTAVSSKEETHRLDLASGPRPLRSVAVVAGSLEPRLPAGRPGLARAKPTPSVMLGCRVAF